MLHRTRGDAADDEPWVLVRPRCTARYAAWALFVWSAWRCAVEAWDVLDDAVRGHVDPLLGLP